MWLPDKTRLVKVRLHNQGEDVETPWAEDLGQVGGIESMRRVRLGNVPFLHAKPTYGDVIIAIRDDSDGMLDWDSRGVGFEDIGSRIEQDDGRWVVIIDYQARAPQIDLDAAFKKLDIAGERRDIVVEGAFVRADGHIARAYLAIPRSMTLMDVLGWLRSEETSIEFTLVHPMDSE